MTKFSSGTKTALLATTFLIPASLATKAMAQDQDGALEEIIVTAQKRTENLQDVPVSVQVLGNRQLEDLNVNSFDDYIQFLPTVSFSSTRPGIAQVYMRGIVSGSNGNHSASRPSVGVYLDEQPITTINEILDLHIYDIARVETLSGPQGTLFGASSQAGTMRIITNKPVIGEFEAGYDLSLNKIAHGEWGYGVEGFVNIPISDRAAVRLVGWHETDGGYIDNVPGSITYPLSLITVDNADVVEDDFNNNNVSGARALLKVDLNDSWTVTPGLIYQESHSTGVFDHDPEDIGDLQTTEFFPSDYDENWVQATVTVEGNIAGLDVIYAGSYLDRDRDSSYDYSGYAEYLESYYLYLNSLPPPDYNYDYQCLYYTPGGDCADPSQFVDQDETFSRQSHELRISSPQDGRLRWVAGLYYQNQKHDFDLQWIVPDMDTANSIIPGGLTTWQTKQIREDRDRAAFAEVAYDITDQLTLTGGVRFFKFENTLFGFNGFLGHCTGFTDANGVFTEDREFGTPQFPCFDTRILDGVSKGNGESFKVNLSYQIDDDKLIYATYSEGFRVGGVNRARVPGIPNYEPDWVFNYEFGWKTTWLDNRLRFNGSVYQVNWRDFQIAFLDFSISNLTIIGNLGQARTRGAEFDLTYVVTDAFTWSFSASYNEAEIKEDYFRRNSAGDLLLRAPVGSALPFAPKIQFTSVGRYEFDVGNMPAFAQVAISHTGKSWNDIEALAGEGVPGPRQIQKGYTILNLSAGINKDNWSLNFFADNVTDTRAQINRFDPGYPSTLDTTISTNRPRTLGVRFGQKF